ncbi:hypothetical protein [Moraxella osloensis]|nr:hypothetical protein [Moraxella osloensis]
MLKSCFMVRQKFAHASSHQERRKSTHDCSLYVVSYYGRGDDLCRPME